MQDIPMARPLIVYVVRIIIGKFEKPLISLFSLCVLLIIDTTLKSLPKKIKIARFACNLHNS